MNKMVVWFHSFPDEPEVIIDSQLFERINLSVFSKSSNDERMKESFNGDFNDFIKHISNNAPFSDIKVVLPANEVLYTSVSVPSKSRNRIMQALPFLLEDLLASDIDKQYFALGDIQSDQCNIAITRSFIVDKIFEQFKKHSLPASMMTSEIFLIPWTEKKWGIGFIENNFVIRTGEQEGITNIVQNIDFVLRLLLNKILPDEEFESDVVDDALSYDTSDDELNEDKQQSDNFIADFPDTIIIYGSENEEAIKKIKNIGEEYLIDVEVINENIYECVLTEGKKTSKNTDSKHWGINLFQGQYSSSDLTQIKIPFKKTLITFFILAFVSQVLFMGYQWKIYSDMNSNAMTELESLYFKTFPDSKRIIDVRTQAESKLQQLLNTSSSNSSFLSLLALVGDEIRKNKNIRITALQYNDGILQFDIQSNGFVFNTLKSSLENKHNLLVEEKSSSRVKGKVHSVINFRVNEK